MSAKEKLKIAMNFILDQSEKLNSVESLKKYLPKLPFPFDKLSSISSSFTVEFVSFSNKNLKAHFSFERDTVEFISHFLLGIVFFLIFLVFYELVKIIQHLCKTNKIFNNFLTTVNSFALYGIIILNLILFGFENYAGYPLSQLLISEFSIFKSILTLAYNMVIFNCLILILNPTRFFVNLFVVCVHIIILSLLLFINHIRLIDLSYWSFGSLISDFNTEILCVYLFTLIVYSTLLVNKNKKEKITKSVQIKGKTQNQDEEPNKLTPNEMNSKKTPSQKKSQKSNAVHNNKNKNNQR
eukprot:TRINITY_DN1990_c0_g1_i1.p1 TRINITY_DN1990_c0_g1~~TRINITY_DN1990_c0_g1_i1.p1  ORF type:complete len:297 (-),score=57.17 TRINITY_DN1990_c0_g1_i1:103-993(-)